MGFGGLITGLGIAGFAALAGGVSLGGVGVVVVCVLSCRGSVVCSAFCSASGAGILGFITGRGITGFAIGLLTGGCSDFVSANGSIAAGISVAGGVSFFILSSVAGFGFITGRGITGFAVGLLAGGCSDFVSANGSITGGISVAGRVSFFIVSSVAGFGFITGRGITGFAIGLLTGCSDFVSANGSIAGGISVAGAASLFILSSVTGFGLITGFGISGLAGGVDVGAADVVSPDDGVAVGSLGFIIGRATTGLGLTCSVPVLSPEVSTLLTGGATGNFASTDFKTSGNASIA